MDLILAYATGEEIEAIRQPAEFAVGEENTFEISFEGKAPEEGMRVFVPGTEYGGIIKDLETDTAQGTAKAGGLTWRGMIDRKIIQPLKDQDYATDSGDVAEILRRRIDPEFGGLIVAVEGTLGITTSFQYERYCTLLYGLSELLEEKGLKLAIRYDEEKRAAVVSAEAIADRSQKVEYSSDYSADYVVQKIRTGVNHLICLGSGELKDRTVVHLFTNKKGTISTTQTLFGADEIADIYESNGEDRKDLTKSGKERLKEIRNSTQMEITIESDEDIPIGDIVGGRDYLSGTDIKAEIIGKIVKIDEEVSIEYSIGEVG